MGGRKSGRRSEQGGSRTDGGNGTEEGAKGGSQGTVGSPDAPKRTPPGLRGLTNDKNRTCWLNSVLGLLLRIPHLICWVADAASHAAEASSPDKTACSILWSLLTLAQQVNTESPGNHAVSTIGFWTQVESMRHLCTVGPMSPTRNFLTVLNHEGFGDPRELLNTFLSFIPSLAGLGVGQTSVPSPFGFLLVRGLSCAFCGVKSRKFREEPENILMPKVVDGETLECSLKRHFEMISGESNRYCDACKSGKGEDTSALNLVEELFLDGTPPPYLLICPRAKEVVGAKGSAGGHGEAAVLNFPPVLNLSQFVLPWSNHLIPPGKKGWGYNLVGWVSKPLNEMHHCTVIMSGNDYYLINDKKVSYISVSEARELPPEIILYVKSSGYDEDVLSASSTAPSLLANALCLLEPHKHMAPPQAAPGRSPQGPPFCTQGVRRRDAPRNPVEDPEGWAVVAKRGQVSRGTAPAPEGSLPEGAPTRGAAPAPERASTRGGASTRGKLPAPEGVSTRGGASSRGMTPSLERAPTRGAAPAPEGVSTRGGASSRGMMPSLEGAPTRGAVPAPEGPSTRAGASKPGTSPSLAGASTRGTTRVPVVAPGPRRSVRLVQQISEVDPSAPQVSEGPPKLCRGVSQVSGGGRGSARGAPQISEGAPFAPNTWALGCQYALFFDGGAQNGTPKNTAPTHKLGGAGAIIYHVPSGSRVWSGAVFLPAGKGIENNVTVNTAEYAGINLGLAMLAALAPSDVRVFGDSKVIIGQVSGDCEVSADHLKPLCDSAQRLIKDLRANACQVSLRHVLRDKNGAADDLASLAMFGQSDLSAWADKPVSLCFVADSDDRSQMRHGFEDRWNSPGHGGSRAPKERLKRVREQQPAVPANTLSQPSSQQPQVPPYRPREASLPGPAPRSRDVTGPGGPAGTSAAPDRVPSVPGAVFKASTRPRSSAPTAAISCLEPNSVFWGRRTTGLGPGSALPAVVFSPATYIAFSATENSVRCRWLDPTERALEVLLPASEVLGALTEQELRFLHGHGDLSQAPMNLGLPAPDSERSTFTRTNFHTALEYLNSLVGGSGGALSLGMFEGVQFKQGWNGAQGRRALSWLGSAGGDAGGHREKVPFQPQLLIRRSRMTTTKIPAPLLDDWRRINMIIADLLRQFDGADMEEQRGVILGLLMALPMLCLRETEISTAKAKQKVLRTNFEAFLRGDLYSLYTKALTACAPKDVDAPRVARSSAPLPRPQGETDAPLRPDDAESVRQGLKAVALVKAGNASKGVRLLTSAGPAKGSVETIVEELKTKHPQPLAESEGLVLSDLSAQDLLSSREYIDEKFDQSAVMKAARSIPALGSADQWGWRGREHLLPLLKVHELGELLTEYVFKAIILGRLPARFRGYLAGASLIALDKAPKAGIRPIAIGDLFRRVASKAALRRLAKGLGTYFQTSSENLLQFAVGVPGGAEKLSHILSLLPVGEGIDDDPEGFLGIDVANAFNEMDRQIIFDVLDGMASRDYAGGRIKRGDPLPCPPGLKIFAAHFRANYDSSSFLTYRGADGSTHTILSSRGVQQGDVWGPTLFCAGVHPLVAVILRDEAFLQLLGLSFSDNLTLKGKLSSLLAFAAELKPTFAEVGLRLNPEDSKIFVPSWSAKLDDRGCAAWARFQGNHDTMGFAYCPDGLKIVGCPFGSDAFCKSVFEKCLERTEVDLPKLDVIPDGLVHFTLIKTCINTRLNYFCRCAPPRVTRVTAQRFDDAVTASLSRYLKIPRFDEGALVEEARNSPQFDALIQLRLPVRDGGGGLTSVADVTLPAFYSAIASTIQWLAQGSLVHRNLIPPSPNSDGPQRPLYLGDFLDAQAELVRFGAALVTPDNLGDPERPSQAADVSGLLCPNFDVLLLKSLPDGRAPCPAPRQHSVTGFLLSRKSIFSPDYFTGEGKKRAGVFKEKKINTVSNPPGDLPPLERCITNQGGAIKFGPVSFLAFTPGAAAVDFHFSLWRVWFCFWLGLPLPGDQPGTWAVDRLCRCNGVLDPHGYHRLCCNQGDKPGVSSVRYRAHNLITEAVNQSAYLAGLTSSAVASAIPAVPGSSDQKGDVYIQHPIPMSKGRGLTSFNGTIGDVALVSFKTTNGVWNPSAMDDRAKTKEKHYRKYDEINWNFEALITNVGCNLSDNLLRLLYYLAELQTEKALQSESVGDNPADVLHLFALRSRARVACAVAVGTAMRLLGSALNGPCLRPVRGASFVPVDHDADVPLFPLGSEDCPVFTPFPLARGPVEYVEGAAAVGFVGTV
jgi:ribonuclease HI